MHSGIIYYFLLSHIYILSMTSSSIVGCHICTYNVWDPFKRDAWWKMQCRFY